MYCSAIDVAAPAAGKASPPPYAGCLADGISVGDRMRKDLELILMEGGVDLFSYGHVHGASRSEQTKRRCACQIASVCVAAYESTFPIYNGTATRHSLLQPTAPVHVLTGAAGPPGDPEDFSQPASFTRRFVTFTRPA